MRKINYLTYGIPMAFALIAVQATSCSTGIESTKTIKMSKAEQRITAPTPEEDFVASLKSDPLRLWKPGKRFVIADNKAALILELPHGVPVDPEQAALVGKELSFEGVLAKPNPGGRENAVITFSDGSQLYRYNLNRSKAAADTSVTGLDIPMLIDMDLVERADSLLRGRKLWTLSQLWYDASGGLLRGRKYVPVTVREVTAGNMVFPLYVRFDDENAHPGWMYMNVASEGGIGAESRRFESLFSLTDPKNLYPQISPEVWNLIKEGKYQAGMTKLECRLSLGNPSDVTGGHNWDSLIDIWKYPDGTFLMFEDGLLKDFKQMSPDTSF